MEKSILICILILTSFLSCSDLHNNPYPDSKCEKITVVDKSRYDSTLSEGFFIRSAQLKGDCLVVSIQSGGCSGNTWKVELIDAGIITESNPQQRYLKISMDNRELCEAFITKIYTFDLRPVRSQNDFVLLNLELWEEQIRYEY